jgi:hypothetical protein
MYDVGDGLCVCRASGSAAVDPLVNVGQLVRHTVGLTRAISLNGSNALGRRVRCKLRLLSASLRR